MQKLNEQCFGDAKVGKGMVLFVLTKLKQKHKFRWQEGKACKEKNKEIMLYFYSELSLIY